MPAGPSEVMVVADDSCVPAFAASGRGPPVGASKHGPECDLFKLRGSSTWTASIPLPTPLHLLEEIGTLQIPVEISKDVSPHIFYYLIGSLYFFRIIINPITVVGICPDLKCIFFGFFW